MISGSSSDTVLLEVTGNLVIAPGGNLAPTPGGGMLPATHFLILVSGHKVTVGKGAALEATVLAPNATCTIGSGSGTVGAYLAESILPWEPGGARRRRFGGHASIGVATFPRRGASPVLGGPIRGACSER